MKFKIGDKVRKIKGYKFEGIIISGGQKLEGDRILYSVEVPMWIKSVECKKCHYLTNHEETNCSGMVHIFAEQDLELINN